MNNINVTRAAAEKITELLSEEINKTMKLRTFVHGGGCSGMQYGFSFDDSLNDDDILVEQEGITVVIDSMSMQYLSGSTIDYIEEFMGSNFTIKNPNAETTCGCGSSFSPYQ